MPITVPMAVQNIDLWERPVEVCGIGVPSSDSNVSILYGRERGLIVESAGAPLPIYTFACVEGVLRRRDGLSVRVARERGLPRSYLSHGPAPDVVLKRCSDQTSCEAHLPSER